MYFKQMKDFVKLKNCWIMDMNMYFQSCLETNSSGIGMAREAKCNICKVCSNLVHCIEADNSNIALDIPPEKIPPMAITPLPVGDVTIANPSNFNGRFGPEI